MMSPAPIVSASDAAGYYSNKDNYYFLGQLESEWLGEGASALGLEGPVRSDQLTAVLEGRLPDGSRLGKEVNGIHSHRPGHDLTFSAPKSVSILALVGGDKEMLEAHQHAVRVAAGYVEKLISARETVDGKTSIIPTGKMVAALYTHDTSRNLDPQLHTHMLVANMTELNGKWKALATDYIHNAGFIETVMKMQVTLGKLYRTALRDRVETLGHEIEEVGPHGMWEIKAVPEAVREEYSSRGREVRGAVGAEATLKSLDIAAKNTRKAKVDPSRLRLMERWQTQMKEKGWDMKAYQDSVVPRDAPDAGAVSRAKQHVQVYTDGTEKWVKSIKRTEYDLKTAHDALSPQTERKQAKVIWAMGQPVGKTAIGRAWSRHEAMGEHNLTARVIPATRRFPDPSLALPLYDNNGRSAGLALVSLVASDTGRLMRGDVRMVATQGATGAVMQRSRSGNTHVVRTADEAFKAVREHPEDGVVWQTGDEKPSPWMLKVSQGAALSEEAARAQTIRLAESEAVTLPAIAPVRDDEPVPARAIEQAIQSLRGSDEYAIAEAQRQQEMQAYEEYQSRIVLPEEERVVDIRLSLKDDATQARQPAPDGKDIARIAGEERELQADKARTGPLPALSQDKATGERAVAGQVARELAEHQRDMPLSRDMPERGREIEHQEHAPPRTIQKER